MTIGLVLTIIFLVLKYGVHAIDWDLWVCFLPVMIEVGLELLVFGVVLIAGALGLRSTRRSRF